MPLIFPPSPLTGTTYTDDNSCVWQYDGVKWNIVTGSYKRTFNGVILGLSINYSLTSTVSPVNWDVETVDAGGYYNSLQPSRITIPATGYYNINCTIFTDTSGAGYNIFIIKNGVTTLSTGILNPNQSGNINDTFLFNQGDYIELYAEETTDVGALTTGTVIEVILSGYALGVGIGPANAFSGVKTYLSIPYSTTNILTAISWAGTTYDTNANALALTYWNSLQPNRLTIKMNGYYEIYSFIQSGAVGGTYTITLRKNGITVLATTTIAPNDSASINQIYQLVENDYIEMLVSDSISSGNITTQAFLEVIRIGV